MAGPLTITTVLLLAVSARADYDCLCNYHVETRLYARPDTRLSPVGYLYEFDCQPIVPVGGLDPRWQAVAKDHVINYVLMDNELKILACAGNPPDAEILPTTSTTHTTRVRTTTTTAKKSTDKTNPTSTKHTSLKTNNTTTTYSSSHQTSIPSTTLVSSRTVTVTHTPKTTYTAANSFPSTTYTPSTVSMFKSTQTETKYTLTRKQTDRFSQSSTSHTSKRPTITTDPTLHIYSTTGPTLHSDSTRPSTSSVAYSVHTTDLTQQLNNTSSSVMVHTVPKTKLSSSVTYVSTTGVAGSSSKSPTTVKFETTTVDSSTRNTTTKTVTTTSTQPPIYTTTSVGFHKSTVEPADISPDMSETILFLLNEERSLRAQMDSDADKLEAEIATLTRLRQNATCGCPAPVSAPIAFSAVLTHNIATLGLEQVIVFDHVYTNYGNGYDVRHGVFTAPVDGAYDFTVAMLMHAGKWSGVEIVVNTTPLAKTRSGDDSFYTMGTNSVAVQLTAGDEVYVRHINEADNNAIYGESFSSFTGYLIG